MKETDTDTNTTTTTTTITTPPSSDPPSFRADKAPPTEDPPSHTTSIDNVSLLHTTPSSPTDQLNTATTPLKTTEPTTNGIVQAETYPTPNQLLQQRAETFPETIAPQQPTPHTQQPIEAPKPKAEDHPLSNSKPSYDERPAGSAKSNIKAEAPPLTNSLEPQGSSHTTQKTKPGNTIREINMRMEY